MSRHSIQPASIQQDKLPGANIFSWINRIGTAYTFGCKFLSGLFFLQKFVMYCALDALSPQKFRSLKAPILSKSSSHAHQSVSAPVTPTGQSN